ncbi:LytTR family DNA-binding domain-containing protein [Saprospiraceae bacterium]|nr:LytTR family DNA-binding domain-containing protein [Saprospiraceae bacterium]
MKAILIDDEKNCLTSLSYDLQKYCPEISILDQCQSGKAGILAINKLQPDLIFLDIDMPNINGFEMLEMIQEINFATIFTTAYDQYALQAFKISAVDYLMKPIAKNELVSAVAKVKSQKSEENAQNKINFLIEQMQAIETDTVKKIAFPTFEGIEFVNLKNINYCKGDSNYTHVHLQDGTKLMISKTLRYVEEILCDYQFFRVHNSYIVNLDYVKKFVRSDGGYLVLENGTQITVSRSKKADLMKLFS